MSESDDNFFSRWSRRKVALREGAPSGDAAPPPMAASVPAAEPPAAAAQVAPMPPAPREACAPVAPAEPAPTLEDAARLTSQSDFSRFVAPGVQADVKNAALKKLFTDPHFNLMDGLDTYIDDYGKADPLPASWLKHLTQSTFLGFAPEPDAAAADTAARAAEGGPGRNPASAAAGAPVTDQPPTDQPPTDDPATEAATDAAAASPVRDAADPLADAGDDAAFTTTAPRPMAMPEAVDAANPTSRASGPRRANPTRP